MTGKDADRQMDPEVRGDTDAQRRETWGRDSGRWATHPRAGARLGSAPHTLPPGAPRQGWEASHPGARPGPPPACSPFWCLPLQDLLHQCRPAPQAPAPAPVSLGVWWEGGREGALLRVPGLCLASFLLLRPSRGGGIVSVCLDLCLQQAAPHPKLSVLGP